MLPVNENESRVLEILKAILNGQQALLECEGEILKILKAVLEGQQVLLEEADFLRELSMKRILEAASLKSKMPPDS